MVDLNQNSEKHTVRAVERALDILLCFTEASELGLAQITKKVSLHKSTVFRLLQTLEQKGFIIKNSETEKYRLGYRILELSNHLSGINDPAILFLPEMQRLRNEVDETISLYVRDGLDRIRIQAIESEQPIRRVAPIGARMPLYVGAASKVLVTFENPIERSSIMDKLEAQQMIDRVSFEEMINEIRSNGFATSFEERELGAASIAVPIFNKSKKLIAAISISGPVNRLTHEKMNNNIKELLEVASQLSNLIH